MRCRASQIQARRDLYGEGGAAGEQALSKGVAPKPTLYIPWAFMIVSTQDCRKSRALWPVGSGKLKSR